MTRRAVGGASKTLRYGAILLTLLLGACSSAAPGASNDKGISQERADSEVKASTRPAADADANMAKGDLSPAFNEDAHTGDVVGQNSKSSPVLPLSKDVEIGAGFARVMDSPTDASEQGVTPKYTELIEAVVQNRGSMLELSLTFAGDLPDSMPSKAYMAVSWVVAPKDDDQNASTFGAYGSAKGWDTFAAKEGQPAPFTGEFRVDGSTIVMLIRWDELDGPQKLKWHADTSWLLYEDDETQRTSVDAAPNDGPGAYEG